MVLTFLLLGGLKSEREHEIDQFPIRKRNFSIIEAPKFYQKMKKILEILRRWPNINSYINPWGNPSGNPSGYPSQNPSEGGVIFWGLFSAFFRPNPYVTRHFCSNPNVTRLFWEQIFSFRQNPYLTRPLGQNKKASRVGRLKVLESYA